MPEGSIFELLHVNYRGYVTVVITRDIRKASPLYNFPRSVSSPDPSSSRRFPHRPERISRSTQGFTSLTFEYHF